MTVDECRARSKVHDSRVKRNPSKTIKVGATIHCLCMRDDELMTGYALTWNVQERAGYMSEFVVSGDKQRLLLPAELSAGDFARLKVEGTKEASQARARALADLLSRPTVSTDSMAESAGTSSFEHRRQL